MSSYFFLLLSICSHWRKLHLDRSFQGHKKRSINHIRHCSSRLFCFGLLYCQKRSVNKGQVKRLSRKCDSTSSQISFPAKLQNVFSNIKNLVALFLTGRNFCLVITLRIQLRYSLSFIRNTLLLIFCFCEMMRLSYLNLGWLSQRVLSNFIVLPST